MFESDYNRGVWRRQGENGVCTGEDVVPAARSAYLSSVLSPWTLIILAFALASVPSSAQSSSIYIERTGARETTIRIGIDPLPAGFLIRTYMSDGDYHEVEYGPLDSTVRYQVRSAARGIDYTAIRAQDVILYEGTLGGRPLMRAQKIDAHPWYETLELSLSGFALDAGLPQPVFWIIQPWEARAYLMQAAREGSGAVTLDGMRVDAIRLRVRPYGLLSRMWSSLYWFRSSDGRYLRYEAVRGLPGTPTTVVELVTEE